MYYIIENMKRTAILLSMFVAALAVTLITLPVVAAPSQDVVKVSCTSAQSMLSQIEKTDAALRINRGRVYNELNDLFFAMNARVSVNRLSSTKLASITDDYSNELKDFRSLYSDYDGDLTNLVGMDCRSNPDDFYSSLTKLRDKRSKLKQSVDTLDKLFHDYVDEFNAVRKRLDVK